MKHAVQEFDPIRPEIALDVFGILIECHEDGTPVALNPQHPQAVLGHFEVFGHAALAFKAAQERHTDQVALQVVAPVVVDAGEILGVAQLVAYQQRAAMRASVNKCMDLTIVAAHRDHRRVADIGRSVVAGLGDLGFECDIGPHRSAENPLLLFGKDLRIREYAVRNAAVVIRRPG